RERLYVAPRDRRVIARLERRTTVDQVAGPLDVVAAEGRHELADLLESEARVALPRDGPLIDRLAKRVEVQVVGVALVPELGIAAVAERGACGGAIVHQTTAAGGAGRDRGLREGR